MGGEPSTEDHRARDDVEDRQLDRAANGAYDGFREDAPQFSIHDDYTGETQYIAVVDGQYTVVGQRLPAMPNQEQPEYYIPISYPPGPGNYSFSPGERDVNTFWLDLSTIDSSAISTHAAYWRHCAAVLNTDSNDLFRRKEALRQVWDSDAGDMFLERIGAVRYSMDEWWSACGWIASSLEQLAAAVVSAQTRLYPIWAHFRMALNLLVNTRSDDAIYLYSPEHPNWTPDLTTVVMPAEELLSPTLDDRFVKLATTGHNGGNPIWDRDEPRRIIEEVDELAGLYHDRAASVMETLAAKMVETQREIWTRIPYQFAGHLHTAEVPDQTSNTPDIPVPGMPDTPSAPSMADLEMPNMGDVPVMPVMPTAAMLGMPGDYPAGAQLRGALGQALRPAFRGGTVSPLTWQNGELAGMPDLRGQLAARGLTSGALTNPQPPSVQGGSTLPTPPPPLVTPQGPGTGAGSPLVNPVAKPAHIATTPNGTTAGMRSPLLPGATAPGAAGRGIMPPMPPPAAPPAGQQGRPQGAGNSGRAGPGAAGRPAAGLAGQRGVMPPMAPPMTPPAGQQGRSQSKGGQPGAAPPGVPGLFTPPGTANQRSTTSTTPQQRRARLAGLTGQGGRRSGLGGLAGRAAGGGTAAGRNQPKPAATNDPADTAGSDQNVWATEKAKGPLTGVAPPPQTEQSAVHRRSRPQAAG